MTSAKNEPAFPVVGHWYGDKLGGQLTHGMTLRDYFAAKAMQGIVSALHQGFRQDDIPAICNDAYTMADLMLKARDA